MKRQIYHLLRKLELNPGLAGFAFLAFAIFLTISTDKTAPPHAENNIYQHIAKQFHTAASGKYDSKEQSIFFRRDPIKTFREAAFCTRTDWLSGKVPDRR